MNGTTSCVRTAVFPTLLNISLAVHHGKSQNMKVQLAIWIQWRYSSVEDYLKELKFDLGEVIYEWARGMVRISFGP